MREHFNSIPQANSPFPKFWLTIFNSLDKRPKLNICKTFIWSPTRQFSWCDHAEGYSKPSQTSKLKLSALITVNPLSTNPTKWSNTLKQLPSVFDHFVKLALKGLRIFAKCSILDLWLGSECASPCGCEFYQVRLHRSVGRVLFLRFYKIPTKYPSQNQ